MEYKLVLLVRSDLKMSKGKTVAQCAHAVVDATTKSINTEKFAKWRNTGETIICLKVKDLLTMQKMINTAKERKINANIITDEGLTEFETHTQTVGYIGPDLAEKIDKITGQLKCL
tara:strand:- start:947 stop:1294 length:348 start_codon:yes stop_codon:yes gene_type:complete